MSLFGGPAAVRRRSPEEMAERAVAERAKRDEVDARAQRLQEWERYQIGRGSPDVPGSVITQTGQLVHIPNSFSPSPSALTFCGREWVDIYSPNFSRAAATCAICKTAFSVFAKSLPGGVPMTALLDPEGTD